MAYIRKYWKFGILALLVLLFLWQHFSSWAYTKKLYGMLIEDLKGDAGRVVSDRDRWIKECEDEILRLQAEKEKILREKEAVRREARLSASEIGRLKGENDALRIKLETVAVPDSVDLLFDGLRRRFPSIRKSHP